MYSFDLVSVAIGVSIVITAFFVSYAAYQLAVTLKALQRVIADIKDTTGDIQYLKYGMKVGVLRFLKTLTGKERGGENDDTTNERKIKRKR